MDRKKSNRFGDHLRERLKDPEFRCHCDREREALRIGMEVARVAERIPLSKLSLHFHDTRGAGLANVLAGLQTGVTIFDGSIGGLGGCPYAKGATGNVATEDLVHMLHEMGIETGVDLEKLIKCARLAQELVGSPLDGHVTESGPVNHTGSPLYCT